MDSLLRFAEKLDKINSLIIFPLRLAVLLMLGLGFWNVTGRYLGVAIGQNLSSNTLIESQWYLFDFIFLLGLGWTLKNQGHVRVDVLQNRWSKKRKVIVELLGTVLLLLPFSLSVLILSLNPAFESWRIGEISPDAYGLPRYWVKSLIPLGFLLLSLQGINETIKNIIKLKRHKLNRRNIK